MYTSMDKSPKCDFFFSVVLIFCGTYKLKQTYSAVSVCECSSPSAAQLPMSPESETSPCSGEPPGSWKHHNNKITLQFLTDGAFILKGQQEVLSELPVCCYLWIPEHSMHMVTPRLMEAQRGSSSPQSQQ